MPIVWWDLYIEIPVLTGRRLNGFKWRALRGYFLRHEGYFSQQGKNTLPCSFGLSAISIFLSKQTSHQQPTSNTFILEQISTRQGADSPSRLLFTVQNYFPQQKETHMRK
jgi:hypothetical protein